MSAMSDADLLRAAAAKMREQARDTQWLAVAAWLDVTADGIDKRGVTARITPAERAAQVVARSCLDGNQ